MKKFITLIIAIAMIATLATGCGVDTPAEDVFNKYDKDTTITETEKDSADKSDDKDDNKSDSDKKDESDKKDDNKSEADKKDDDKVADNKPADNADKNNGSKPSGSGSTNSNTGSKPSGGNSNSGNTGTKPSGGSNNSNTGSKPSGGNNNQSKPVEPPKPSHSHSYAVVSQTGATCTAAGVTTYKCSCGHSYTEQNGGALGHAWQTQYKEWDEVVHHPGQIVEKMTCNHGNVFYNDNEYYAHCDALMEQGLGGCSVGISTEEVGGYDQTVHHSDPCGQKCTRCGANG